MKSVKKRMITPKGDANYPLNIRDLFKMLNIIADAIEELQDEVLKIKKDK